MRPPAARRSRRPFRPGARAACGTGDPRASAPGLPRRALAACRSRRGPGAGGRGALRAAAGYFAGQLARAARDEHIAFAIGARRIAPLGRLLDGAAEDDWREATGMDAAQAAVADHRPGWWPANTSLLFRRALAGLLTGRCGEPTVASGRRAGPVLLIVMYESQTWRVRPGEPFTFGRSPECSAVLPAADRGVSRNAGSFRHHGGWWWLHNDSSSSVLCRVSAHSPAWGSQIRTVRSLLALASRWCWPSTVTGHTPAPRGADGEKNVSTESRRPPSNRRLLSKLAPNADAGGGACDAGKQH